MPFVKLDCKLPDSSIWCESSDTKVCWVTMLTMADADGLVESTAPGLARRAGVSLEAAKKAIEIFERPDQFSKNPASEGRRIERVDGGYMILNYVGYRERDYTNADRQKRYREKHHKGSNALRNTSSISVSESEPKIKKKIKRESIDGFDTFWTAYQIKTGKGAAEKAWHALKPDAELVEKMLAALEWQRQQDQWTKDGGQYIPNPATWLNGKRWMDEPRPVRLSLRVGEHRPEIDQEPQRDLVADFLAHFPEGFVPLKDDFESYYKTKTGGTALIEKLLALFAGNDEHEAKAAFFLQNLKPIQRTPENERKYRFNYITGKYNVPEILEDQEEASK